MKAILIILSFFFILGCKTKKVLKTNIEEIETVHAISEKKKKKLIKLEQNVEEKKVDQLQHKNETQTDIEIKGKAETDKPIELYNIENGDTIQSIKVSGNADVSIKTRSSKANQINKENSISNVTNKVEDFARNIVKEENLKKTGKQINKSAKEVTTRTGTFWSFGLIAILGSVALLIIGVIIYFKKK